MNEMMVRPIEASLIWDLLFLFGYFTRWCYLDSKKGLFFAKIITGLKWSMENIENIFYT